MATPIILDQVVSLPDILTVNHFNMIIGTIPGGGDPLSFTIQNMTAILPFMLNRPMEVELHRHKVGYAGKREYRHTFSATFVDSLDRPIIDTLRGWQAATNQIGTNLPVTKVNYATNATVEIYGADNSIVESRQLFNVWVTDVEDIQLNGAGNEPIQFRVSFYYDYWDYLAQAA